MSYENLSQKLVHAEGNSVQLFFDDPLFLKLQEDIDYKFQNQALLFESMTHTSFAHEKGIANNEVLEFLGDAVLDLAITQKLLETFPQLEEGQLSKLRSAIVNKETLAEIAQNFGIPSVLLVGKGELQNNGNERESNLSDALEALIGAIFQEVGYQQTSQVIMRLFAKGERDYFSFEILDKVDVKGQLQELVYKMYQSTPSYRCSEVKNSKPILFKVAVEVEGKIMAEGVFNSKKKGMQSVASQALKLLKQGDL